MTGEEWTVTATGLDLTLTGDEATEIGPAFTLTGGLGMFIAFGGENGTPCGVPKMDGPSLLNSSMPYAAPAFGFTAGGSRTLHDPDVVLEAGVLLDVVLVSGVFGETVLA